MQFLLDTNICIYFLRGMLDLDTIIKEKGLEARKIGILDKAIKESIATCKYNFFIP